METIEKTVTIHRRKGRRRQSWRAYLGAFLTLTILFLAAGSTARAIMFAIDVAASRAGTVGGEIMIPAHIVIQVFAGWTIRGIVDSRQRKEVKDQCGNTAASIAALRLTPERSATARRNSRKPGPR